MPTCVWLRVRWRGLASVDRPVRGSRGGDLRRESDSASDVRFVTAYQVYYGVDDYSVRARTYVRQ